MGHKRINCDLLVVGAGPAGGSAAHEAASNGLDVVIVEKRKEVGVPIQCAEYIPNQLVREVNPPDHVLVQKVEGMCTHLPDGEIITTKVPGFIINRDEFDKYLVWRAINKGARLYLETKAISYDGRIVLAKRGNTLLDILPRVIIGADGPLSTIGRWIGSINQEFIQAVQYVMPLKERKDHTEVYFSCEIPGGYGWVFPKRGMANVGVGVNPRFGVRPRTALNAFVRQLIKEKIIAQGVMKRTGGLIPVGGLLKLNEKNVVLTGDAGGLAHPITGAGVANAVLSGKLAGGFASQAILKDDLGFLGEYEDECREFFFDIFAHAHKKKSLLERYWRKADVYELSSALKWGWVAFPEYYSEWGVRGEQ